MNHLTEQDFILHYYGEATDASHLDSCPECRARYRELQSLLNVVSGYVAPERANDYESAIWKRLEGQLPVRATKTRRWQWFFDQRQWAASGLLALLLVGAFYAGRLTNQPGVVVVEKPRMASSANGFNGRVLLTAVGNHLDRSQYVLAELDNSEVPTDVRDLLEANRLYRQSAQLAGETAIADLLDDLERLLVEIEHLTPSVAPRGAEELREKLPGEGLLFRVRALAAELREREQSNQLEKKEH